MSNDIALMFCQSRPVFQDTITPGTWRCIEPKNVAEEDHTYWQISGGAGYFDDEKRHDFCVTGYINKADARLIAAAPELLGALNDCLIAFSAKNLKTQQFMNLVTKAERAGYVAISKATGAK